jgi:Tol biopolymer transport system component/predicted Ser/Thr protein kinase
MIGSTIAHYRIDAELGRGGMGIVYRAHDLKLDRPVALKFLPQDLSGSPAENLRLLSEARAAATINHPNACTIHGIEEAGGHRFIVMELVEGRTLHDVVRGSPLDPETAVKHARQIAEALHEAHGRGIVHRDVKSENIMIDARGRVRVMDFGLARLKGAARNTRTGSTVGTLAYMAPEQIRGEETDARADIFSFGVVLYEMLTGRVPFRGEHDAAVMYSIMNEDPEPLRAAAADVPDRLASLVEKTLRKLPSERQQSLLEVLTELDAVAERSRTRSIPRQPAAPSPVAAPPPVTAAPAPKKTRFLPYAAGIAALLLSVAALLTFRGRGETDLDRWARKDFTVLTVPATGVPTAGTLTPDGKSIVYATEKEGGTSLLVRQIATGSTLQILGPLRGAIQAVAASPDGEYVYYTLYDSTQTTGGLFRVPILGGTPRRIVDGVISFPSFSPDGASMAWVAAEADSGMEVLNIAAADGSGERTVLARRGDDFFMSGGGTVAAWSPDGSTLAMGAGSVRNGFDAFMLVTDPAGSSQRVIDDPRWATLGASAWLPDGSGMLLIADTKNPSGISRPWLLDPLDGNATPLLADANRYSSYTLAVSSDNSRILVLQQNYAPSIWTLPLQNPAEARRIADGAQRRDGIMGLAWTPDGDLLYTSDATGSTEIWRMRPDGSARTQLSSDTVENIGVSMSPDGRTVFYGAWGGKLPAIWRMNGDGTGVAPVSPGEDYNPEVSADGRWVYFDGWRDEGRRRILRVPAEGGTVEKVSELIADAPAVSSDGRLIFCRVHDPQRRGLRPAIVSAETGALLRYLELPPGASQRNAFWISGDREILLAVSTAGVGNLWAFPVAGGPPRQVTMFDSDDIARFALSMDRSKAAVIRGTPSPELVLLQRTP